MLNIAVLVSGGGTNLQALLDSEARGENPNGKITLVVASKPGVFALERAAKAGVEGCVVRRKDYAASEEFDAALLETLRAHKIDLVVLAGFLSVLGPSVIAAYPRRILNVLFINNRLFCYNIIVQNKTYYFSLRTFTTCQFTTNKSSLYILI